MRNILSRTNFKLCVKLTFILLAIMAVVGGANAATLTVTNTNDSGAGSLRQALADAVNGDTIDFAVTGVISLTTDELVVNASVTISGPGKDQLTIERSTDAGTPTFRIFLIGSGNTVTISGLTITGGRQANSGGILNFGNLTLKNSTVSGNSAIATGGGIGNSNKLTMNNSTISSNSAGVGGGGIYNQGGITTLNNSTVSGNSAGSSGNGGGITNAGGITTLNNSTVSGNSAGNLAGGIYNPYDTLILKNSTISNNKASSAGGIYHFSGSAIVGNSIIAGNKAPSSPNVLNYGSITSNGYNLIGNASGLGFPAGPGDQVGTNASPIDPMLSPLADNGGPTFTHAPLPGSPAIDKGKNINGLTTDQRGVGFVRTVDDPAIANAVNGDGTDIGAFEVQPPACEGVSFAPAVNLPAGNPYTVTTGDLNGDGKVDLVSTTPSGSLSVLINNGNGTFQAAVNYAAGNGSYAVTTGDFNGDGKIDLATADFDNISVLIGFGDGTFGPAVNTSGVAGQHFAIATADFNGDGKLDLVTPVFLGNKVSVFIGNGDGTFAAAVDYPVGTFPWSVTTGDFNGDGKIDLAAANAYISDSSISVLIGNGDGTFGPAVNFVVGGRPFSVIAADLNGDNNLDLVSASAGSNYLSVLLGNGSGSFASAVNFTVENGPDSVTAADFNGDGKLDLAAANGASNSASVLIGRGDGTFDAAVNFAVGTAPKSVTRGDFNGDGRPDFATANEQSGDVSVVLNNGCASNTAPVANNDGYSTNEDTPLNVTAPGVLGNDTDGEGDPLTAVLVSGPSHGSLTLNSDGSFAYTPTSNYNGSDSFTYKANDGSLDSNTAMVTITVKPINDAPAVSATPKTQSSVQYSDPISTVTITASDLETPASALTIAFSYTKDGGASQSGLPAGMAQGGTAGAWTVSGVASVPQGTYVITAAVTDTGDNGAAAVTSTDSFTIVVTRENAVASPKLNNPVSMQVVSAGGTATGTTAQICFDITEPSDGSAGDTSLIDSATVLINAVGGGSGAGTITPSAVTFTGGGVSQASTACFTLTLTNTPVNVYEIELVIGGNYYTGSGTTVFTVFDPSAGFASGGGWIINPNTGYRANYGVNVKYLKNGNYQGSLLYVEHRPDGDYKVKSTSLNSTGGFAILPITGGAEADIAGKANFGVNDVLTGNYSFIARVIDKGTPGTNDQFGLKLINPSGQVVSDFTFAPQTLGGGNNQVPKK